MFGRIVAFCFIFQNVQALREMEVTDLSCLKFKFTKGSGSDAIHGNFTFRFPARYGHFYNIPTDSQILGNGQNSLWMTTFKGVDMLTAIVDTDYQNWAVFVQCANEDSQLKYEEHIVNIWLTLLSNYPNATVLDLGSNIGVFTLASLSMGNKVISVDPSPQNHAILFNSIALNNIDDGDVIQVMNPISDGYYVYSGKSLKQGETNQKELDFSNSAPYHGSLTTITLFDIFDLKPEVDTFIIKIDVQGFECKVLTEFFKLEKKPKFVPYIQMETTELCYEGWESECFATYKTEFLPLLEKSGYIPHVPWPVTFQDIIKTCYFDVLFVHVDAKPFPYWDKHLSKYSFLENFHVDK